MPGCPLSVVIAVWDELENLVPLFDELLPVLEQLRDPFEVVVVDDGSTDGSSQLLDELAEAREGVRVVHLDGHFGKSAALDAGFHAAAGDVIATLDADLQQDPADIPVLLRQLGPADAVIGVRAERRHSRWRRFCSRVGNGVRNRILGEAFADSACPLKVMRAEAVRSLRMFDGAHRFMPALMRLEGRTILQAPVHDRPRRAGRSKYGAWNRAWRGLRDTLGVRWMADRRLEWRVRT
jgi:glycosyltransferase involved in cell wall biosynthesis